MMTSPRRLLARGAVLWPVLLATLLGAGPCSDRGEEVDPVPPGYPTSPSDAVLQLRNLYFRLDLEALDRVLAEDFDFELASLDADTLGIESTWDRDTELEWTQNMFEGKDGRRADGSIQPPIDPINAFSGQVVPIEPQWIPVHTGPYAGSLRRRFYASWFCQYQEGDTDIVQGTNEFYVIEEDVEGTLGEPVAVWRIVRWQDHGVAERPIAAGKHEVVSWARMKAKFATRDE